MTEPHDFDPRAPRREMIVLSRDEAPALAARLRDDGRVELAERIVAIVRLIHGPTLLVLLHPGERPIVQFHRERAKRRKPE